MARSHARRQWNHNIKRHGQQQGLPRHFDVRNTQQKGHDGREGEHHDDVVQGDLDQCVVGIAFGKVRPYENHGRAGRRAQQNQPRNVLVSIGRVDQIDEQPLEEQHTKCGHGERLDQPVDHNGDDQALGPSVDAPQAGEIDRHHHGIDHGPDQDRDGQIDRGIFPGGDRLEQARRQVTQKNARDNAESNPEREIAFEQRHWSGRSFRFG